MGKINSKICRLSKKRAAYSFYICTTESNIWNLIYGLLYVCAYFHYPCCVRVYVSQSRCLTNYISNVSKTFGNRISFWYALSQRRVNALLWPWIWYRKSHTDFGMLLFSNDISQTNYGTECNKKCASILAKNSNTPLIIYCGPMEHFCLRHLSGRWEGKKNMEKKNNSAFMKKSNTIQLLSHSYQAPNEMTLEDLIEWTNEEKNETKTTEIIIIYTKQKVRGREKERTNTATPNRGITGPFSIGLKKRRFAFFCMHVPCTWPVYFAIILFFLFGLFALIWHCLQFWQARRPLSISKPIYFCCIVIIVTNEWVSWAKVAYTFI